MDDSGKSMSTCKPKLLNPWMLHFQKFALELKCPLCLSLFKKPVLLPCDHMFCISCLGDSTMAGSECALCNTKYSQIDIRHVPFVENMVSIYRSLDATVCANLFQQRSSDDSRSLGSCQTILNSTCSNKKADLVMRNSPNSNEAGVGKNIKSKVTMHGLAEEIQPRTAAKPYSMQCSPMEIGDHVEMDVNQVTQSAPDSPPFCDTKGSDNNCSDQVSGQPFNLDRSENSSLQNASRGKENLKKRMGQSRPDSSASETEGLTRDLKRQKNVSNGDNLDFKSDNDSGALVHANAPNDLYPCTSTCSFCQSSKISEATGPMLHYVNGKSVTGDAAMQLNVIHVHTVCINWAPQVYFVDGTVKKLKEEVARGAKLKCSKCSLKGAALGCYVKSCRRTYHVPCAMDMPTCRWDYEEFLLLCPAHTSAKFPNEKSKPKQQANKKHPAPSYLPFQQSNQLGSLQDVGRKMVFCGSALSNEEKVLLINFASKVGAIVTKSWTPNVTHVIAATDANGACSRTLKVLMAILNGRWILKMGWIKACMEVTDLVEEEPYEINLDSEGCHGGPKAGRLGALSNEPKVFSGLNFYFSGDYVPGYKEDLKALVEAGGGTILSSKDELEGIRLACEVPPSNLLVVYNLDPPEGCKLGEEVSILWERMNEAEDLATNTGCQVIGQTWILESIATCKLQPIVS